MSRRGFARGRGRQKRRFWSDLLLAIAVLVPLGLIAARQGGLSDQEVAGRPEIVDGDTLDFLGERVRLVGIDAPELDQSCSRGEGDGSFACGHEARRALAGLAQSAITCRGSGRDRYGRLLAVCRAGDADLNEAMVRSGWAVAYGRYTGAEREARQNAAGLWAGAFERPQEWRRRHGDASEPAEDGILALLRWLLGFVSPGS